MIGWIVDCEGSMVMHVSSKPEQVRQQSAARAA
jgi:hypothetical protein